MKKVLLSLTVIAAFAFASCDKPATEEAESTAVTPDIAADTMSVETATGMDTTQTNTATHGAAADSAAKTGATTGTTGTTGGH